MRISQCIIVERSEDTEAPVEHGMHVGDVMEAIVDPSGFLTLEGRTRTNQPRTPSVSRLDRRPHRTGVSREGT